MKFGLRIGLGMVFLSVFVLFAGHAVNPASDLGVSYETEDVLYEYNHHWSAEKRADFQLARTLVFTSFGLAALGTVSIVRSLLKKR